jgi:DegV family protein with EDD domain
VSEVLQQQTLHRAEHARRVAIVTESTCCLPPALARQYGIDILPIPYTLGEAEYRDGVDMTRAQFYDLLRATRARLRTSPPSAGDYLEVWRGAAERGEDTLTISVDGSISTMSRSTRLALRLAADELPEARIRVVDSHSAGMGQGFVALAAARLAATGAPLEAVAAEAERIASHTQLVVALDTLDYLARSSRIPQVAAIIGGMLSIRPVFTMSADGVRVLGRPRTRARSIAQIIDYLGTSIPPGVRLHAAVQHASAEREAAALEQTLRERYDCAELYTTEFTPVMGGYCGPGLLGVAFYHDTSASPMKQGAPNA